MPRGIGLGELLPLGLTDGHRQRRWRCWCGEPCRFGQLRVRRGLGLRRRGLVGEERVQVGVDRGARFDGKAGHQRLESGIGQRVRRIEVELATPDQSGPPALLEDRVEEMTKDLYPVARGCASGSNGQVRARRD